VCCSVLRSLAPCAATTRAWLTRLCAPLLPCCSQAVSKLAFEFERRKLAIEEVSSRGAGCSNSRSPLAGRAIKPTSSNAANLTYRCVS
jgi:hypothetical protein